jgi:copper chaperone CopZ
MKKMFFIIALIITTLFGITESNIYAKPKKVEFKVFGNCGMCKSRIEKALKVEGVESAVWDEDTKIASVVFDQSKVSEEQFHKIAAKVGHDTEKYRASDEDYSKLPGCCKYEREEINDNDNHKPKDEDHRH